MFSLPIVHSSLLVLTLGVTLSSAADPASFIGPKGGDTRKGVYSQPELTHHQESGVYARVERPWYIGPKGGDIRRGMTDSTPGGTVFTHPAVANERASDIGPKGGHTRRGF